jgi:hypothetical protein
MGLAGRRRSDRCSSRLSPAESRSRRRSTPQRLRSRPRSAQSPPRWQPHRRPSHRSVARIWVTPRTTQLRGRLARGPPHQHPDEHRSERPILLAVDTQIGEGAIPRWLQNSPIRSAHSGRAATGRGAARRGEAGRGGRGSPGSRRSDSSGRTAWSLSRRHDGHPHAP